MIVITPVMKPNHRYHYRLSTTLQTMFDSSIIDTKIRHLRGRECHTGTFMLPIYDPFGVGSACVFRIYWYNCDQLKKKNYFSQIRYPIGDIYRFNDCAQSYQ